MPLTIRLTWFFIKKKNSGSFFKWPSMTKVSKIFFKKRRSESYIEDIKQKCSNFINKVSVALRSVLVAAESSSSQ